MRFFKILLLVFITGCSSEIINLPYYNSPDFTPIFINDNDLSKINHKISDFNFIDQNNDEFELKKLKGKIHVANFIFTSCGNICPIMTNNMGKVEDEFKNDDDVTLLSFSVTPWIDSPEVLNFYKKEYTQNSNNWYFLTGKKNKIYDLARKSYFAEKDIGFTKDSTDFLHTEHFLLVDRTLRVRGIYNGTLSLEMQHLIEDIKLLKNQ